MVALEPAIKNCVPKTLSSSKKINPAAMMGTKIAFKMDDNHKPHTVKGRRIMVMPGARMRITVVT